MINLARTPTQYPYQPTCSSIFPKPSQIAMLVLLRDQQCFHICLDQKPSHLHVSFLSKSHNPVIQHGESRFAFQRLYFEFCNFLVVELALNFFGFSGGFWRAARRGGGKVATWWRPLAMAGGGTVKIFKKCAPNGWWH